MLSVTGGIQKINRSGYKKVKGKYRMDATNTYKENYR